MKKVFKLGYSVKEKRFMVRCSPHSPMIHKNITFMGPTQFHYNPNRDIYYITPSIINAIKLHTTTTGVAKLSGYTIEITNSFDKKKEKLQAKIKEGKNRIGEKSKYEVTLKPKPIPKHLDKVLMDFQKEGVKKIIEHNGRVIVGDDMGLGKTIEVLTFIKMYPSIKRILVIAPKTIKHVWDAECAKWGVVPESKRLIIDGRPDEYDLSNGFGPCRLVVINYAMVGKWIKPFLKWNPDMVICDEIHKIKNKEAQRTQHVKTVAYKAKFVIGMTGTPAANSPMELFTICNLIRPKMWDYTHYNYKYCGGQGMQCRTAFNPHELNDILYNSVMFRRLKSDVMKDLPPKRQIQVELEIDTTRYDAILEQWAQEEDFNSSAMSYRAKLRECIAHDKIPALLEWADKFLEDTGRKLILFAHHKFLINMLESHYGAKAVKIDGSVKTEDRRDAEYRFQNDDSVRVFIGSLTACSEGLTLTAANDVCMCEMLYNPKTMEQAEDRAHRKGQNNHVTIWNLICTGTYEEGLLEILNEKRVMISQIVDGMDVADAGASVQRELTYKLETMIAERKYK